MIDKKTDSYIYICICIYSRELSRENCLAEARRGCCATIRCLAQIYSLYKHVPLAGFCFVFVNDVLVTRKHESGDVYTLFACSDPFSLYYVGTQGTPCNPPPSEKIGLSMIMQY